MGSSISAAIVYGETTELFCRWAHTDAVRTKVARGQACRILSARMETEPRMLTFHWVIETTTQKDDDTGDLFQLWVNRTTLYEPDIVLTGSIFRDPISMARNASASFYMDLGLRSNENC